MPSTPNIVRTASLLAIVSLATTVVFAEDTIEFDAVEARLQLPEGLSLGPCSAVDFDSRGRLYLFHRGPQPILCFDAQGQFLRSWGADLIGKAHGLRVDADDHIWVTDIGHHMVFKFDAHGKLLLALGKSDRPGTADDQFHQPTDIAFGPDGVFYVSDGYGNSRVLKFAANGKLLAQWGTRGKEPGQFHLPHAIAVDRAGRLLVGDRENDRIQIFDADGKFVEVWTGFAPYGLEYDAQGNLFVADGRASQVLQVRDGKVMSRWGKSGQKIGEFHLPHMLAADSSGNLYIAEVGNQRVQMLKRRIP